MATSSNFPTEQHSIATAVAVVPSHHNHGHHMIHRSSTGQLMDSRRQRQREERERWLGQWANIWTKRQSPEWKPRRASVASCQQQQQQQQQTNEQIHDLGRLALITGARYQRLMEANSENVADLRKFLGEKIQQSRSNLNKASQSLQEPSHPLACFRAQSAIGNGLSWSDERKLSLQEDLHRETASNKQHSEQQLMAGVAASGQSSWKRQSPSSVSRSPSNLRDDEAPDPQAIDPGAAGLIEKLELQDKQRKSLIFSMALRQMIADGASGCSKSGAPTQVYDECGQTQPSLMPVKANSACSNSTQTVQEETKEQSAKSAEQQQVATQVIIAANESVSSSMQLQKRLQQQQQQQQHGLPDSKFPTAVAGALAASAPLTCCLNDESDRNNKGDAVSRQIDGEPLNGQLQVASESDKSLVSRTLIEATTSSEDSNQNNPASIMSIAVEDCDQHKNSNGNINNNNLKTPQSAIEPPNRDATSTVDNVESNINEANGPRRRLSSGLGADSSIHSTGSCDIEPNLSEFDSDDENDSEQPEQEAETKTVELTTIDPQKPDISSVNESPRVRRCNCDQSATTKPKLLINEEIDFESLVVESWLDDHPSFVHDYFMRKANRQLIDDWLITHAKSAISANLQSASSLEQLRQPPAASYSLVRGDSDSLTTNRNSQHYSTAPTLFEGQSLLNSSLTTQLSRVQQRQGYNRTGGTRSSSSQSGHATPVRKISATDFESRIGSGFLRPMVSTTPDGRPTFLTDCSLFDQEDDNLVSQRNVSRRSRESSRSSISSSLSAASYSKITEVEQHNFRDKEENSLVSDSETLERRGSGSLNDAYDGSTCDDSSQGCDFALPADKEMKLIFELVKNICNDLDINTLLHKILKNIAVLINADKSSLFLVCGEPGDPNRRLVSQLFNVDQDSADFEGGDSMISIPWGTGLVGYVAASGESVNIDNCYDDPRFTNTIDQRTGYVTKHMLCAPIFDKRNEIVGVAQVINKRDGKPFTRQDEIKFKQYLQFCGIGLRNAQSYENCQLENKRNQVLLDLARMVFEEQSTIEQVVYRIMLHTQSLLECQRCQVLLIDDGSSDLDHLLQLPSRSIVNTAGSSCEKPAAENQSMQPPTKPDWRPQFASNSNGHANDTNNNNDNKATRTSALAGGQSTNGDPAAKETEEDHVSAHQLDKQQQQCPSQPKLFSLVFDLECDGNDPVMHSNKDSTQRAPSFSTPTACSQRFPINIGITGYVAMTGETLNIKDAHLNDRFDPSVDEGTNFRHKSILCMPIRNGQRQIIGVSQLINKKNGRPFNKNDEDLFEAFAIFCGLGIHNTLMYEKVLKIMAKQRVTFEVLSYHATAPLEEAKKLNKEPIPSCYALNLSSLKFNDFSLDEQFMLKSCLRFFLDLDLIRRFQIDQLVFCNWILSVQKNYRKVTYHPIVGGNGLKASPVRYHNWRHAFNVTQMMFAILINTQICQALGELETLALLIACLCHDLDHRGTNNSFQIKSASPLAELYSTSTMEHHHFDQCVMILNSQGNQILANLSPEEYSRVIVLLEEAILATDLANYFQKREVFFRLVNSNQFEWYNNDEHRSLLRCMLMTACDVAAITKPWPVQKVVADLVMSEFYQQGDIERQELNIEPIDMMNRDKMSKLPEMQIGFIDSICAPIYVAFARLFPAELGPLLDGCLSNRNLWTEIAKSNNNNNNNNDRAIKLDGDDIDQPP